MAAPTTVVWYMHTYILHGNFKSDSDEVSKPNGLLQGPAVSTTELAIQRKENQYEYSVNPKYFCTGPQLGLHSIRRPSSLRFLPKSKQTEILKW